MEFIRKNLLQIKEQLGQLTLSQKLLFFMILVVIGISLFWTVYATAKPELVALLDQSMSDTEIASIQNRLDQWDVFYKVEGGKILVKRQERDRLLARLQMDRALPSDMTESWRKLVLEADMWLPQEDRQNRWQLAKEQRLAQIIRYMDGVQTASVIINTGSKRLLSDGPSSDPSASVSIETKSGVKPGKALINAVADLVSSAVDRLSRERVSIVVNGVSYRSPGDNSPFSSEVLEMRQEHERYIGDKIQRVLGINNALVGVFVELDTDTVQTEKKEYTGDQPLLRERETKDTSIQKNFSGEPGVRPNTGGAIANVGQTGDSSEKTESEVEYSTDRNVTHTIKRNLPGTVKSVRATVNIPYSYFEAIWRQQMGKKESDKPKESDLAPIVASQEESIRKKILPVINATDPSFVEVSHYYDLNSPVSGGETVLASSGGMSGLDITQYGKTAGLVLLAFSSLVMVLMMLRKASGNVGVAGLDRSMLPSEPTPELDADAMPVGEASGTEGILEGIEVDEGTLRARKMAEQVATMVKEDPTTAANLVRQWIIKDR